MTKINVNVTTEVIQTAVALMVESVQNGLSPHAASLATPLQVDTAKGERNIALGSILSIKSSGTSDIAFSLTDDDGNLVELGKHNGQRFYWKRGLELDYNIDVDSANLKKIPPITKPKTEKLAKDKTDKEVKDVEGDEEEGIKICEDKSRYEPFVRKERVSMDCADKVAKLLRTFDEVPDVMEYCTGLLDKYEVPLPKKSTSKSWKTHAARWKDLNPGQQRMLIGQALRTGINNEEKLARFIDKDTTKRVQAFKARTEKEAKVLKAEKEAIARAKEAEKKAKKTTSKRTLPKKTKVKKTSKK